MSWLQSILSTLGSILSPNYSQGGFFDQNLSIMCFIYGMLLPTSCLGKWLQYHQPLMIGSTWPTALPSDICTLASSNVTSQVLLCLNISWFEEDHSGLLALSGFWYIPKLFLLIFNRVTLTKYIDFHLLHSLMDDILIGKKNLVKKFQFLWILWRF